MGLTTSDKGLKILLTTDKTGKKTTDYRHGPTISSIYICLIWLKRGHWFFAWGRAQPGSRPARCPQK